MPKKYSIAEARRNLPSLVDEVAAGATVELTRRGEPIAVVLSVAEYERFSGKHGNFGRAFDAFRRRFQQPQEQDEAFRAVRDRTKGRRVHL